MLLSRCDYSNQDNSNLLWSQSLREVPIIQVVVEVTISRCEFEFLKEKIIVQDVEGIKNIEAEVFGLDESVLHQFMDRVNLGNCIVRISNL